MNRPKVPAMFELYHEVYEIVNQWGQIEYDSLFIEDTEKQWKTKYRFNNCLLHAVMDYEVPRPNGPIIQRCIFVWIPGSAVWQYVKSTETGLPVFS